MPSTPCSTTATAASFSPCSSAAPQAPSSARLASAKANISSAEGSMNPTNAASPPNHPARSSPIENPSWLLAGPGRNWHSASSWPKCASSSQRRRSTNARRK
jgi:hypothetical protein